MGATVMIRTAAAAPKTWDAGIGKRRVVTRLITSVSVYEE
jgi:hypothetical protein